MNEKIKELANQAWQYANDNSCDGDNRHGWLYRDKFAELIVLECCKQIQEEPFNAGAASIWLKDHFGVKE